MQSRIAGPTGGYLGILIIVGLVLSVTTVQIGAAQETASPNEDLVVDVTAEGVSATIAGDWSDIREEDLRRHLAGQIPSVSPQDVVFYPSSRTIDVAGDVSVEAVTGALESAGVTPAEMRPEPSASSIRRSSDLVVDRVRAVGYENVSVPNVSGGGFQLRVRNGSLDRISPVITNRGAVTIVATRPTPRGVEVIELGSGADITDVGGVERYSQRVFLRVRLSSQAAASMGRSLRDGGILDHPDECGFEDTPEAPGYCLGVAIDGELAHAGGLSPSLATMIEQEQFAQNPVYDIPVGNPHHARLIRTYLRLGVTPASLQIESVSTQPTEFEATPETSTESSGQGGFGPAAVAMSIALVALAALRRNP